MEFKKLYDDLIIIDKEDLNFLQSKLFEVIRMWENHSYQYDVGDWNAWIETSIPKIKEICSKTGYPPGGR